MRRTNSRVLLYALLALLAVLSSLFLVKGTDLRVYWYGVRNFFAGVASAYGPDSGITHPMEYRYPPATYLLLYPLPFVPLRIAEICWGLAEWIAAVLTVRLAMRVRGLRFTPTAAIACSAAMLSYIVLAIRYENVQPFVICAIFTALLIAETRPVSAGLLLALAVTFKIWPILFLPWFVPRQRIRAGVWSIAWLAALWTFPALIWGVSGYKSLMTQWYNAMTQVATTYSDVYYVLGQSLRDVSLRYFSPPVAPATVAIAAEVTGIAVYCLFMVWMLGSDRRTLWIWDGVGFVLYSIVEPHAVKSGLISLGPAVLTAACLYSMASAQPPRRGRAALPNRLFIAVCAILFAGALIQYRPWQRFLLVAGLDLWAEILLLAALTLWATGDREPLTPGRE